MSTDKIETIAGDLKEIGEILLDINRDSGFGTEVVIEALQRIEIKVDRMIAGLKRVCNILRIDEP